MGNALSQPFVSGLLSNARHLADNAWAVLTSWQFGPSLHHHFTRQELNDRLICFGVSACACLLILSTFAVLAVSKRRYGTVHRAYLAMYSAIQRERERLGQWRNRGYQIVGISELQPDDHDEEDMWPGFEIEVSEEAKAKDAAKMAAKIATIREKHGGGLPEDLEHLSGQEQPTSDAGSDDPAPRPNVFRQGSDQVVKMTTAEKQELIRIQAEEFREQHSGSTSSGCTSWILCAKMQISAFLYIVYICTCMGIPLLASKTSSCDQGFPWEAHIPFFGLFMSIKFWELFLFTYDDSIPGQLDVLEFFFKFSSSFLGFVDGYSDAVSIVIAHQCSSDLWYWMAFFYFFGVVVMQWLVMGFLALCFDSSGTCFFKMMHMDALSLCCTMAPTDTHALLIWKLVNIFRTLFEDLPQCVLQIMFIHYVKQNYVMVVSVLVGVGTSCLAVLSALKRAAEAAGTNWERLQALGTMNRALVDEDYIAFSKAAADAEAQDLVDADQMNAQWAKAEVTFDLPCGRKYFSYDQSRNELSTEVKELIERSAEGASAYGDGRRSSDFAREVAEARQQRLRDAETSESAAFKRGAHHEGRHTKRNYDDRRRTVEFAIRAQAEREKRIQAMLVDVPAASDNVYVVKQSE